MDGISVRLMYTNWKDVTREREIIPLRLWYGSTTWHAEKQYLIKALDCEDDKEKDFALSGFKGLNLSDTQHKGNNHELS